MHSLRINSRWLLALLLSCAYAASSSAQDQRQPSTAYPIEPALIEPGHRELVSSDSSMVTSAHPFATDAGVAMLRQGGNAIDAAIAASMVLAVLDTGLTSFAGGGELTYYDATHGKTVTLDFDPNAIRAEVQAYGRERFPGRSIRVPGSIAGFHYANTKYGKLEWARLLEPAISYAENGYPLHGPAYAILQQRYDTLTLDPSGREIFAPNGFLPPVGSLFKQPALANTLRHIAAEGPGYFYKGQFADQMVAAVRKLGGKMTKQELADYHVLELAPMRGEYNGFDIVGPPLPGTGTAAIIEGLNILANVDLRSMGHYSQSADAMQWVIETLRVMLNDSRRYGGIEELDQPLVKALTSKDYARAQYKLIEYKIRQMKADAIAPTQSVDVAAIREAEPEGGTHHIVAVDKKGNVCSITHTIWGPIYSSHGLFVGGIVMNTAGGSLNAGTGSTAQPGERMLAPIGPIIVFKDGKPAFATGSSGGTTNTFLTALNVLVWGRNIAEAQEAPRLRLAPGSWSAPPADDATVYIEHRISSDVAEQLRRRGYRIEWVGPYSQFGAQMISIDQGSGRRFGAADPRLVGKAAGE